MSPATRRRVLAYVEIALGLGCAVYGIAVHEQVRFSLKVLAAVAIVVALNVALRDLRAADRLRYGTFTLLVVCDCNPDGVTVSGLDRLDVWLQLAQLDPDHHLVWIDGHPLFGDWRQRGRFR